MFEYLRKFKKILISSLTLMMGFVLLLSTIELGWVIAKDVITPPVFILDINELLDIFGLFMLVLIGVELLETIMKTYLTEGVNHAEIVISVAIIAIARKVIHPRCKGRIGHYFDWDRQHYPCLVDWILSYKT